MTSDQQILDWGRKTLEIESRAVQEAAERLGDSFVASVKAIASIPKGGRVIVTGLGKSGHAGAKLASTLSSTGTPSFFLHASEALHGDFGMIGPSDLVLAIAYGGETREVLAVCKYARERGLIVIGLTGAQNSGLAAASDHVLNAHVKKEADALGLAPTASTTVTLGLGDALAAALMHLKGFTRENFARLHPGGSLGRSLLNVADVMKPRLKVPTVTGDADFHSVLEAVTSPNFGIVCVIDDRDRIKGSVTDGDLRRALLAQGSQALQMNAQQLMNPHPRVIAAENKAMDAVAMMERAQITSLFVSSSSQELLGLVRLHDLMSEKLL